MLWHVMVGANDVATSKRFYDAALSAIGVREGNPTKTGCSRAPNRSTVRWPRTPTAAPSASPVTVPEMVKAFHDAGVMSWVQEHRGSAWTERARRAGFLSAYLRDPFGNKVCALHRVRNAYSTHRSWEGGVERQSDWRSHVGIAHIAVIMRAPGTNVAGST
jgi:hypothetical protein